MGVGQGRDIGLCSNGSREPASEYCVCVHMCVSAGRSADLQGGGHVCVSECTWVRHVCPDVCRSAGAERLSVCECVQEQEWACGCVCGGRWCGRAGVCCRVGSVCMQGCVCARGCQSRCDGTGVWAVDRWGDGCEGGFRPLCPFTGAVGAFGPEGLASYYTFRGSEQGQPPLSLAPSSPDRTIPVLFSLARSSTTTWRPASRHSRRPV